MRGEFFSASVEQRALARNYSSSNQDVIDVYVVNRVVPEGGSAISGQAVLAGARTAMFHGLTPGIAPFTNNVFVNSDSVKPRLAQKTAVPLLYDYDALNQSLPFVLPHEIGHILLDAGHAGDMTQLMRGLPGPDDVNRLNAAKRISRELRAFGVPAITGLPQSEDLDQGALMRSWPNHD